MLRKPEKSERQATPSPPNGSVVYAVGDIHGRADLLEQLHARIEEDARARAVARMVVVYIGDYVDRGPRSRGVIDLLLDRPLMGFESVHLIGNHEDFMLRFLDDPEVGPIWLANGGDATLASYGVDFLEPSLRGRDPFTGLQAALRANLPPRHLDFLRQLRLTHIEGDYLFVHAGIRPEVPLDRQSLEDLLWIRGEFLNSRVDHGWVVVHGHSITREPDRRANRIGIDTGAFASGHLTCLVLDGAKIEFLQT